MTSQISAVIRRISDLREPYALVVLLVVAALTRFPFLGHSIADVDETCSWYHTGHAMQEGLWASVAGAMEAPLFTGMNAAISKVFGLTILNLRIPQAVFGTLAVALVFLLVRQVHSMKLAFVTGLLCALSPYLIFYSMQARAYSQMLFFSLLFSYMFFRSQGWRSTTARRLLLALCTVLAVGSHFYVLVFFAGFYAVLLGDHLRRGRRDQFKADFVTGLVSFVVILPLLITFVVLLRRMPGTYWNVRAVTLPSILTEQFWLPGTTLGSGTIGTTAMNLLGMALLLLPLGHAVFRKSPLVGAYPLFSLLWLLGPCIPALVGLLCGLDLLHYPRGHIASSPFLFAYFVLFTESMAVGKWWKRTFVAVVMVPFLISSWAVVTNDPAQAFFKNRDVMVDIANQIDGRRDDFDLVAVHHWFLAPFFKYYLSQPDEVMGLGTLRREEASENGELFAIVSDTNAIPAEARVLLVLNDIANIFDPDQYVLRILLTTRRVIEELPCHEDPVPGDTVLCSRIILFDAAVPPRDVEVSRSAESLAFEARFDLAMSKLGAGRFDEALLLFGEMLGVPSSEQTADGDSEGELAYVAAAAVLARLSRYQEAEAVLREGMGVSANDIPLYHALARILAGSPIEDQRDPARALELALDIHRASPSNYHAETVAMALAAAGRLSEAIEWQQELIARVEDAGNEALLVRLRGNLSRYEEGQTCCVDGDVAIDLPQDWHEVQPK